MRGTKYPAGKGIRTVLWVGSRTGLVVVGWTISRAVRTGVRQIDNLEVVTYSRRCTLSFVFRLPTRLAMLPDPTVERGVCVDSRVTHRIKNPDG